MFFQPLKKKNISIVNSNMFVVLITVLLLLIVNFRILSSHNWNPKAFVLERSPDVPLDQGWNIGYDGQWAYKIALDPLGAISEMDQAAYRYQRIFYPLFVFILSMGNVNIVPWMMIIVNLVAAAIGCYFLGSLLQKRGASPWYALVLIFSLGYLLCLRLDLLEPLTLCLALIGLFFYEDDNLLFAIVFFALGGLTKEIALVFPFSLMVWEGLRSNWKYVLLLTSGFIPYVLWYFMVNSWLGITDSQIAQSMLMIIPFSGFSNLKDPISRAVVSIWVLFPALLGGSFALVDLVKNFESNMGQDDLLVIGQVVLIASMPMLTWADPIAILRIGLGLIVAILLWSASLHPRILPYAAALWLPSCLILFMVPGLL